ncbi:MAG: histidinol-phosphate transaminase [Candidatus Bathyarchaeota archaeon]|nr:histidinol-phosphate transaminase [Candidatus Bathyarchaeota archaeon]
MSTDCKKWLGKKLERLQGSEIYNAEKTNAEIAQQYGLKVSDIVKLNYNENLYSPREKVVPLLKEVAEECDFRIYPQNEEARLKEKISEYMQVPAECIAMGNSSDEVMERVIRIFLEKGEAAVTFAPTFSVFKYCVKYHGVEYVQVPLLDDFGIDMAGMRKAFTPNTRLLYLCSPNNPTAGQLRSREVEALIEEFSGIVLVDEAYGEYADYSVVPLIKKYENLIVLRTFSKAFSLAGLRLGYAVACPVLAKVLDKSPAPYPVNVVSLSMGRKMLENIGLMRESVGALKAERGKLINALNEIKGIGAFDSKANFVLFNTTKPYAEVYEVALSQGLVIKKLGKLLKYENCLRTTVGLPEMNAKLLKALCEYMGD